MVKHFALDLLTIKLLKGKRSTDLTYQLEHVWTELRDHIGSISIEDPANPTGNDLSELLNNAIRSGLSSVAAATLQTLQEAGWQEIFGPIEEAAEPDKLNMLQQAAVRVATPTKPWSPGL
jgi:hypothetical protein